MSAILYLAPAGAGKTATLLDLARRHAADLVHPPRVVVATRAQVRACRQRLASTGGAMGIRLLTFGDLYAEILQAGGSMPLRLPEPVRVRVVRALLDQTSLTYLGPLRAAPSMAGLLASLYAELQSADVTPEALSAALGSRPDPPRLGDLLALYTAYCSRLAEENWVDAAGLGSLARQALETHPTLCADWPLVLVDGGDDLSAAHMSVLAILAARAGSLILTLTGQPGSTERVPAHRRAQQTCEQLEAALGIRAQALPFVAGPDARAVALVHLQERLSGTPGDRLPAEGAIEMLEAPERTDEVRAGLRWLKQRILRHGVPVGQTAILARHPAAYRAAVQQIAAEYGMPVALAGGLPLEGNPAVACVLALVHLATPAGGHASSAYPWRQTVDAWRSPYLDLAPLGIEPADADALEAVARWGMVLGGLDQWRQALGNLVAATRPSDLEDDNLARRPPALPVGADASALAERFERFVARITPPLASGSGALPCRAHVRWLEDLIGDQEERKEEVPDDEDGADAAAPLPDLGLARRSAAGESALVNRDLAALNALKDVLRGLVWTEETLGCETQDAAAFVDDLASSVHTATYIVPLPPGEAGVFVGSVDQAQGLSFDSVVILGLAEGEFPATLREDTLLRDAERARLRDDHGMDLRLRTESEEAAAFYSAVTRARQALLLTRPRIAEHGAPWQASPYWDQVRRNVSVTPRTLTTQYRPAAAEAASWPELWQTVSGAESACASWAAERRSADAERIAAGAGTLQARAQRAAPSPRDGSLSSWSGAWQEVYGAAHRWSVSQLESYRRCPFGYFAERALGLEPRRAPAEGLDARQLGTLYHRILADLYGAVGPGATLPMLLEALEGIAQPILDAAPRREGFRPTAWWMQTRQTMLRNLRRTLSALETLDPGFAFLCAEQGFGRSGDAVPALVVPGVADDSFQLGGIIDRVDRDAAGRLRIVDYKTGSTSSHSAPALQRGEDLQIALYALAAQALCMGVTVEGFYWSVANAEASPLKLASYRGISATGPAAAVADALGFAWEAVHAARAGRFQPDPRGGKCVSYCAAAGFCWHYKESYR